MTYTLVSLFLQLKLVGPPYNVFTAEEIKDFWDHIDCNGDGVINMSQFSVCQSTFVLPFLIFECNPII